ncbi:alpha-N-arabinofuranosidase precursor, putative [Talaromyces stipitatus ATCC 10500]|uniref:Alpha-L-arabinofuranosidase n=1 Tax=Talaromyces stipitatus (strain ATCC 10500 / CBS 375.48 / QM 6759 / NRRL 1006) TaxID=441959 RepID=B8MIE4_TALSN|nr:alpha-N-arabinofuranosidase precursor, putative [Talaromyces stipitatus ATCC 10500]EED14628.1 alpha-N-arabinofuranosidase precursor, putative [Talaromyces stipitatus ATCC 10500]
MFFSRPVRDRFSSVLALCLYVTGSIAGPCDIYSSGGTPCVAAHSTTRALYDSYTGALYQVSRGSDGATTDISPLSAGGVANSGAQDSFCANTTCLITIIYDQSGHGNDLTQAPPGGAASGPDANGYDYLASAVGAPVTLNGEKAYGYRNNNVKGTATGDEPEGLYAVFDGTHYNTGCCFDYGNAETNSHDTGNGHMEAIYFGTGDGSGRGTGSGSGPWIMADLENGLFSGYDPINNAADPTITSRFVTAIVKGESNQWAIRGGDATSGSLSTYYSGIRPANGYNPMQKEGAIILGIGGDNSNNAQGTFYEGVMTSGYPSDDIENQVQANIVAAGYATTPLTSGPGLTVGENISMRATTACCTTRYLAHTDSTVNTQVVTSSSGTSLKQQASWTVRTGLGNTACFSFESVDSPGSFIRHSNYELKVNANDGSKIFSEDATFCPQAGLNGQGNSFRSWSYPTRYWRHYNAVGYIASNGGPHDFDSAVSFNDDVSFVVSGGFA